MVFERLFKGRRQYRPAETLYETVVAQARHPAFYTEYGVADGFEQRFDMLVLHAHLLIRRLTAAGAGELAQTLFDARSEEHTSELQSLMRISYAVFCLKKKTRPYNEYE